MARSISSSMKRVPHQLEPNEAEDIGTVDGFVKILIEFLADGMVGDQS
jgi:hypothetical protein